MVRLTLKIKQLVLKKNVINMWEEAIDKKVDVTDSIIVTKFEKQISQPEKTWREVVIEKADRETVNPDTRLKYISDVEALFGEIKEKFSELPKGKQKECLYSEFPIAYLYTHTNLSKPKCFKKVTDRKVMLESLKEYQFDLHN